MTVKEISEAANLSEAARALVQDTSTPPVYVDSLEKQELYQDAIRFLAQKMPPDAGIKWASKCAREMQAPEAKNKKDEPLDAADTWIKAPNDTTRWAAKEAADKSTTSGASNLVAMAVYMSGGSVTPPGGPEVLPPPGSAQKMVAGSVIVAVVSDDQQNVKARYQKVLAMSKEFDR